MMIAGGLNLETGLTLQPGPAAGQGAAPDTGFMQILAALDAGAVPIAAPADGVMIVPAAVVPAVTTEIEDVAEAPADEVEQQDAEPESDEAPVTIVAAPFVAPPIAISVTSPSPVVVQRDVVSVPANVDATPLRQVSTPAISIVALPVGLEREPMDAVPDNVNEAVIAGVMPAKATGRATGRAGVQVEAVLPRAATPVTPNLATALAPAPAMVEAAVPNVTKIPPAVMPVADVAAQTADAPSTAAAAPIIPPLPIVAAPSPEVMPAADVAPDTARQLAEQSVTARLDIANEAQMIDRLARDIAQLSGAEGRLKFQLNPEHLGSLHVEVEQHAEGVSLRFGTETESARQVIADAQHRLVSEARAQGMRIAETHVDLGSQNQQGGSRGREAQPQPGVITSGEARELVVEAAPDRPGARDRFA